MFQDHSSLSPVVGPIVNGFFNNTWRRSTHIISTARTRHRGRRARRDDAGDERGRNTSPPQIHSVWCESDPLKWLQRGRDHKPISGRGPRGVYSETIFGSGAGPNSRKRDLGYRWEIA